MERYQVILVYDGTDFQGFQRQGSKRTVQAVVEEALRSFGWRDRTILYAGRTDTGVHASGQVIAFDLDWAHEIDALGRAMNAALPADVAARSVKKVAADFNPRHQAWARQYRYHLFCRPERDPLRERYAWRVWPAVQAELLQDAANCLPGIHDFAAFGSPMKPGGSTVRMVYNANWEQEGEDAWSFSVSANAFLYRMVRRLVFLQVLVGRQKLPLEEFAQALQDPKVLTPGLAKPNGLVLEHVIYPSYGNGPEGLIKPLSASGEKDCG